MKKRVIIRFFVNALKFLVALAAIANLVALFVYHYELPSWLRRGRSEAAENTVVEIDPELLSPTAPPPGEDVHFSIPVVPVNYSGEANMDALVLGDVYVYGSDDQPIDGVRIEYSILPGESRLKKTIEYTAYLPNGETLTETRTMNLTSRYTGPTITLLGNLPGIDPAEAEVYVEKLDLKGIMRADDGFGNNVMDQVVATFEGLSDEEPDAVMKLHLENQIHDTYDTELTVYVKEYTGIVLVLTDYNITLNVGDYFDPYDYILYAHDVDGTDLSGRVVYDDFVDTDEPGEYYVVYWVWNMAHDNYSPDKFLYVTVVEPEDTTEAEEMP